MKGIILIFGLSLVMTGCVYDSVTSDESESSPEVYLSITRAQAAGTETFNEDGVDYEDRVHDLAMLVFDSSTGAKVCEYYDTNIPFSEKTKTYTVKMTPGQRDFYFVANMPMTAFSSITNRTDMDAYMAAMNNLDAALYQNATETKGFPMSRIYTNQTIGFGGTAMSPLPFKPGGEDAVKLIRVVAKLEVQIPDADFNNHITKITLKNAFSQYRLDFNTTPFASINYSGDKELKKNNSTYLIYMPQALMSSPAWSATDHKPINYFVIETTYGLTYEVPIVTYTGTIAEADYLKFATGNGGSQPDYNIYRNHHYLYIVQSPLVIYYTVTPWQTVNFQTYLGYGYNVQVDESGKVTVYNTIAQCDPHVVTLTTAGSFKFSDNTTTKTFNSLTAAASAQYTINPVPSAGAGAYLTVTYNGTLVKTFSK